MKKILCASLTLFLLLLFSGCSLEKAVTVLGKTQLTKARIWPENESSETIPIPGAIPPKPITETAGK